MRNCIIAIYSMSIPIPRNCLFSIIGFARLFAFFGARKRQDRAMGGPGLDN